MNTDNTLSWTDAEQNFSARWHSEGGNPPPKRVVIADDTLNADTAYRLACEGTALLWQGDFQNARQLMQALVRRIDRKHEPKPGKNGKAAKPPKAKPPVEPSQAFNLHRQAQSQRARTLGMLLIPFAADHSIPLRRAPDVRLACAEVYGPGEAIDEGSTQIAYVASLRELLGIISAHEWRKKGLPISALGNERIHAHYGVFSPVRGEYIDLVATAPMPPDCKMAFDIGTGTGVLAAVLARRGAAKVIATDQDPRALACATENIERLQLRRRVSVVQADLFPEGRARLIVCNPPWLPARPSSALEHAIYDPESRMLRGFLAGLADHLEPGGEGWLILSDLAEHLGLRSREELLAAIDAAGLKVLGKMDIKPTHPKVADEDDPLHAARAAEITRLWRLVAK